jgi:hypothetical protein
MSDTATARERLLDVISFTECANGGTSPDALLDAYRDQLLPPWEAVYESATFTPRLIAYCTSEVAARGAAEAWLREHGTVPGGLEWMPDPQMVGDEWSDWHALTYRDADGLWIDTDVVVRRRAARTTTAQEQQ